MYFFNFDIGNFPVIFAQHHKQYGSGYDSGCLYDPEHADFTVHEEKIHKVHVGITAQQDGGGITHERGSAFKV